MAMYGTCTDCWNEDTPPNKPHRNAAPAPLTHGRCGVDKCLRICLPQAAQSRPEGRSYFDAGGELAALAAAS